MTRHRAALLGRRYGAVALCVAAALDAAPAAARDEATVVGVTAALRDSALVCAVDTRGLPDAPSRETLASGLPSAVVFACSVLDASGKSVGGSRAEIRIEPDLWENAFVLRAPAFAARAASLREVEAMLAHINPIPILPLRKLQAGAAYRVRVRMAVEPLAPSEIRRTRGLLTGDAELSDPDRREALVGLDALLRFFLGKGDDETWVSESVSIAFRRGDLPPAGPPTGSRNP